MAFSLPAQTTMKYKKILRQLLSLPYVSAEHIGLLLRFYREANGSQPVLNLLEYINATWIRSEIWPPTACCVSARSVTTSNDIEGWHYRLNLKERKGQLNFYSLLTLLYNEIRLVTLQVHLSNNGKALRYQKTKYIKIHGQLVNLWDLFSNGHRSAKNLLKAVSHYLLF